ncbi:DNA-binding CsgD family transcriptional regulator [Lewinella marina]|uniref:LuxR family transcriptional regulator n=1 Tax=Neolewinella marina TaxID=438751 RepID=A0A2G0CB03_9BACT|nr:LuxR C-terminal-related transcriptional regulator [Neolewinella marina]NJB85869.1 DNA-binding CsgD family transcriptional regulator [Neolewinella marina]PHK97107.1 LuxR family transcriptional regulator [Neolewinella marina]
MRLFLIAILLTLLHLRAAAQELPPVIRYAPTTYGAGSQNWMVGQDDRQFIYVANNEGLLEFNGSQWRHYPSPNESVLRSVYVAEDRVYTGSYMEFGYWDRQADGGLCYHSLTDGVTGQLLPDEQFWDILAYGDALVFQSLQQFFLYHPATGEITSIRPPGGVTKTFRVGSELYFTNPDRGLYALEGGAVDTLLPPGGAPGQLVHAWAEGDELFLQTDAAGTFRLAGTTLLPVDRFPFLSDKRIYRALALQRGGHAFGTISNGVYLTDASGRLTHHLNQVNGLTNNTVLSLFQDAQSNLWVGSDHGLNCINLPSPVRKYTDRSGRLGTVHASARHAGRLYLGSNQGLFVRDANGGFTPIAGTRGQVWSLFVHDGQLFCGHDSGTFLVEGDRARLISDLPGTWTFQVVPGEPDLLLQGHYRGLSVLERGPGGWALRNSIEGFDLSARYLVLRPGREAYVSHEYRGVYGLRFDPAFRRVTELLEYPTPAKGKNAGLVAFQNSVYYYSREGIFVLEDFRAGFRRSPQLNEALPGPEYLSGRMTATADRLWFVSRAGLGYFHQGALSKSLSRVTIPLAANLLDSPLGYENITPLGGDTLLLGTADGYLMLARAALPLQRHELYLTRVTHAGGQQPAAALPLTGEPRIPFGERNLGFAFSVPDYSEYFRPRLQYRLSGLDDRWSEWKESMTVNFPGLPYGKYQLEARSLLGRRMSENTVTYSFTILRPWYASYLALILYFLGAAGAVFLLHRAYTRYYRRKQRLWQVEQDRALAARERQAELELTRLNNERLREDIEAKNREAALSTMNLVKKNELLQQIKEELLAARDPQKNIREVVKQIDRNIDEAETWELFRDAFENADRDFFKKVKDRHPELTPNDLKLCAYLRLNLSSKEIAPMLNISPRSVEVKRYRLRKKMGLERDTGLTEYILEI